jgi:dUTP pyrophosphatase
MQLRVKRLSPFAHLPTRGTPGAAAFDFYAALAQPRTLAPHETARIPTGLALEIPGGLFGLVKDRSSLALKGLRTSAGVIDSDYRGEVQIVLTNTAETPFEIEPGMRIAQMILLAYACLEVVEVAELSGTERGSGGFGSTG